MSLPYCGAKPLQRSSLPPHDNDGMKRAAPVTILAFVSVAGACAESPDAQTILAQARKAYTSLKSYEIHALTVNEMENQDFDQTIRSKLLIAYRQPGKYRIESKGLGATTAVSDGAQVWTYNAYLKQYTKNESAPPLAKALNSGQGAMFSVDRPGASVSSVKLTGEETLVIGGAAHPCYLLAVAYENGSPRPNSDASPTTYWVDKSDYLVLKTSSRHHMDNLPGSGAGADMKMTATVESLKVDEPLQDDLFTFKPPAGAKLVSSFEFPGMSHANSARMLGTQAPDFKLRDLADNEVQLATFRGKTVLLDFWATWCGPCREEIPLIETLHRTNKDLVVLGIDVGEDADVVQKFVKGRDMSYPVLLAGHDRMVEEYGAHAFPTVAIIDKAGVIRAYKTGYDLTAEAELRQALADAAKPAPISLPPPSGGVIGGIIGSLPSSAPDGPVYRIGGGVTPPVLIQKIEPGYSEEARKAHISGTILLSVVISAEGVPRDIRVMRPLGHGLDEKAVIAASQWRFKPAMKDGKAVAVQSSIQVNFRLLDNSAPPIPNASAVASNEPATAEEAYREGMRLIRAKRVDEGLALLGRAIALKPDWAQAYAARGRALYQAKRYAEAVPDFDAAIRLDPTHPAWYDSRGLAYSYSGRHARGIEDYTRAIELAPNVSATPYGNRGWAYSELGQLEPAIADLTKAIQMTPDFRKAYENRAIAYTRMQDWPHAIADFSASIELEPNAWAYRQRAAAKRALGDTAGADEDLQKAAQFPGAVQPAP